ncbi:hypothetical protein FRC10_002615 [Ceratobasidium sp. 414]|nr:hypothetical protein FRC10_002615 [Ceratobasidium sp. 414]
MSAKDKVESAIAGNKVVLFSKSYCPYCKAAKQGLDELGVKDPVVFELDQLGDGAAIQQYLEEKTKQRTVPNIFISQTHVGGNDDFQKKRRSGEVQKLLV